MCVCKIEMGRVWLMLLSPLKGAGAEVVGSILHAAVLVDIATYKRLQPIKKRLFGIKRKTLVPYRISLQLLFWKIYFRTKKTNVSLQYVCAKNNNNSLFFLYLKAQVCPMKSMLFILCYFILNSVSCEVRMDKTRCVGIWGVARRLFILWHWWGWAFPQGHVTCCDWVRGVLIYIQNPTWLGFCPSSVASVTFIIIDNDDYYY